jgi:hypothetical protein
LSAVRTATTFKEKSAKDFRGRDMMTHAFNILRASLAAGVKRMILREMRVFAHARPVVKVHKS